MATTPLSEPGQVRFFDLPAEIRNRIYVFLCPTYLYLLTIDIQKDVRRSIRQRAFGKVATAFSYVLHKQPHDSKEKSSPKNGEQTQRSAGYSQSGSPAEPNLASAASSHETYTIILPDDIQWLLGLKNRQLVREAACLWTPNMTLALNVGQQPGIYSDEDDRKEIFVLSHLYSTTSICQPNYPRDLLQMIFIPIETLELSSSIISESQLADTISNNISSLPMLKRVRWHPVTGRVRLKSNVERYLEDQPMKFSLWSFHENNLESWTDEEQMELATGIVPIFIRTWFLARANSTVTNGIRSDNLDDVRRVLPDECQLEIVVSFLARVQEGQLTTVSQEFSMLSDLIPEINNGQKVTRVISSESPEGDKYSLQHMTLRDQAGRRAPLVIRGIMQYPGGGWVWDPVEGLTSVNS